MILGGLWSGLAAALLGLEQGTAAGYAVTLYQFTFLAAIFIDTITLVVAFRTRASPQA
jgi:NO-binding membrane sensor protein with MHYT domain